MFMVLSSWQSHCESSPSSFDKCRTAPSGRRPKTKPDDLSCESACTGCQNLHPPSLFIITHPESWYSFYRPTEGRRLSRPSWLVTYRDGLPIHRRSPILVPTIYMCIQCLQLLLAYISTSAWQIPLDARRANTNVTHPVQLHQTGHHHRSSCTPIQIRRWTWVPEQPCHQSVCAHTRC